MRRFLALLLVCALHDVTSLARAEQLHRGPAPLESAEAGRKLTPVTHAADGRVWADGVSPEGQRRARELFEQGNALLKNSLFKQAAEKYRQALVIWAHPGIHYNLSLALINLDRPLEGREHLKEALRFGAAPLDEDKYKHARSYLKLIEQQLAPIEITCADPGAIVELDGELLFRAPGRHAGFLRPGTHSVRARKLGHVTVERKLMLLPGETTKLALELHTEEELTRYRRRWPLWGPAAVTAGGAALGIAGALLLVHGKNQYESYDARVDRTPDCADDGCFPSASLEAVRDRAKTYQTVGGITLGVGAATLTTGAILLMMNTATPYRIDAGVQQAAVRFTLEPMIGSGFTGLRASGDL